MKKLFKKAFSNLKNFVKSPLGIGLLSHIILMTYCILGWILVQAAISNNELIPIVAFILLWAFPTDQFMIITSHEKYKRMVKKYEINTKSRRD